MRLNGYLALGSHRTVRRRLVAFLAICLSAISTASPAASRIAMVLGNGNYEHVAELPNSVNDADAIAAALVRMGFDVIVETDLPYLDTRRLLRDFGDRVAESKADVSVFYYAGHGLQVDGRNYIVPIDARLEFERDLEFEAITFDSVLKQMEQGANTNLVFLDACRNNPLSRNLARSMGTRSVAVGRGLAQMESGIGTLIAYATQPGNIALDGKGVHSPFTGALLNHLETPGLEVRQLMSRVRREVHDITGGEQVPWDHSSLLGDFYFLAGDGTLAPAKPDPQDLLVWREIAASNNADDFRVFLERYPDSDFAYFAESRLATLERASKTARATAPSSQEIGSPAVSRSAFDSKAMKRKELESEMLKIAIRGTANNGGPFKISFKDNGTATVVIRKKNGNAIARTGHGRWWTIDGRFCMKFLKFGKGKKMCPQLREENTEILAFKNDGSPIPWEIERK